MKILITGGAGFIGSHIADACIEAGHEVAILDNFKSGEEANVNPRARLHRADIRDASAVRIIFEAERPDIVSHHAAMVSVAHSLREPGPTMEVNVMGTLHTLLAAKEGGVKKFIFASTGGVIYGEPAPERIPVSETEPLDPLSPYALSKKLGEDIVRFYSSFGKFSFTIFRYANVYGPRQTSKGEAGVIPIFSELMREGRQPTIFGDGTKTRDYVHIEDVVAANMLALLGGNNETINIGTGRETTDQKVFTLVARAMKYTGKPLYAPFREGENRRIALDATRAKKILGWEPRRRTLTIP